LHVGLPEEARRFEARVTGASGFAGEPAQEPEITVGKPRSCETTALDGRKLDATCVTLANPDEHDIDLVFEAEFSQPHDGTALLGVRVRARSEREWIIAALPGKLVFLDEPGFSSTRVSKLALI